jgi:hypothetical protein
MNASISAYKNDRPLKVDHYGEKNTFHMDVDEGDSIRLVFNDPCTIVVDSEEYVVDFQLKVEGRSAEQSTIQLREVSPKNVEAFLADAAPCKISVVVIYCFKDLPQDPVAAMLHIKAESLSLEPKFG